MCVRNRETVFLMFFVKVSCLQLEASHENYDLTLTLLLQFVLYHNCDVNLFWVVSMLLLINVMFFKCFYFPSRSFTYVRVFFQPPESETQVLNKRHPKFP